MNVLLTFPQSLYQCLSVSSVVPVSSVSETTVIQISYGHIVGVLIASAILAVLSAVVSAWVATKLQAAELKKQSESIAEIFKKVQSQHDKISEIDRQRLDCELRAGKEFCTRGELYNAMGKSSEQIGELIKSVNSVSDNLSKKISSEVATLHNRITENAKQIAEMKGSK